jgi:two-component system, OmpR family, manganese sensing response regulator
MQILLVDDEIEMTQPVAQILRREGYDVSMVHDGLLGQKMAMQESFDLLILDWMLPGVSGLEICRSLRQHDSGFVFDGEGYVGRSGGWSRCWG